MRILIMIMKKKKMNKKQTNLDRFDNNVNFADSVLEDLLYLIYSRLIKQRIENEYLLEQELIELRKLVKSFQRLEKMILLFGTFKEKRALANFWVKNEGKKICSTITILLLLN